MRIDVFLAELWMMNGNADRTVHRPGNRRQTSTVTMSGLRVSATKQRPPPAGHYSTKCMQKTTAVL